nr:RHS repeat-associated core domain-containing protein [Pseudomonas sp. S13.1.2]
MGSRGAGRLAYSVYGYLGGSERGARLAYNGQFLDSVVRGYFLGNGHRVYSPILMRFHSPDSLSPFGRGGINTYAYCQGDPVNFSDPDGRNRFSKYWSVFKPVFKSIDNKQYRVEGFSYDPVAPLGERIKPFRAKSIGDKVWERHHEGVSLSGQFYVSEDRTLFVRDLLVPAEGIGMMPLEPFADRFREEGFTLMNVNPTHAEVFEGGRIGHDSNTIVVNGSKMTDYSKRDLTMPGLNAAIRKGRPEPEKN